MGTITHILAGFSTGYQYRRELRHLLDVSQLNSSILELDPRVLHRSGIKALALDFDGVLAGHGVPVPLPEAVLWMKRCEVVFGDDKMFILSNKPTEERQAWFKNHFPQFRFIVDVRKKPFPDGLLRTGELAGVPLSAILMVDDRLLTGCLAALVSGARPCYISNPFVSFYHRPLAELFYLMLRAGERVFVRIF